MALNLTMTDAHRMFLQGFMCRGILPAKEVKHLYKISLQQYPFPSNREAQDLVAFVETINVNLKPTNLELCKGISEDITATHYYGLVNLTKTPITLMASDYNSNELEIFKRMIEEIVGSEQGRISSIAILNMTDTVPERKIHKKDIERLLARLEAENWISVRNGEVSLATRSLLELEQYIRTRLPNIAIDCNMCHRICVQGESCINCDVKLHFHCASILFPAERQEMAACPECGERWPTNIARTRARDVSPPPTQRRRRLPTSE